MALFEIVMPKLGESVEEATITKWFINENDIVKEDDILVEIATDKVDSDIPSPVAGRVSKVIFPVDSKVAVGKVIAVIDLDAGSVGTAKTEKPAEEITKTEIITSTEVKPVHVKEIPKNSSNHFYSPLVRSIASRENLSTDELDSITGSGRQGRIRKEDLLTFLKNKGTGVSATKTEIKKEVPISAEKPKASVSVSAGDEIIEMDRIRRLIADHMVMSVHTAPHVTNMLEADLTEVVQWRTRNKDVFQKREGQNLTYMPIITEAVSKALRDFPRVNVSVDGYKIIVRKNINIGIAVSLPDGNLIVPVVKNADQKSLLGIALEINKLAELARANKLGPDDIQGGTFSITNFGSFKNVMGTPIINQPQAAILAVGTIEKKPAVLETPSGDVIAIRHKMFLSLTYDHRAIDGALGGAFLRKVADYLEQFDIKRTI
jgi:2-oxoglutarate dehydrogenase E2 component (dihydrolipoamide succinyltransferase)